MSRTTAILWALAVLAVALLNVLEVLPDWATFAAIFSLPAMAAVRVRKGRC
ncbi:hypothetical protein GCM10011349_06790 [Novosphingobium indicum]|jgi:hypothetical protein|uniref:Uncharacterized protein n=1 Tax=Novosphingobium indicum TaxID=462949 RepID=A0ABQ2J9M3_9SPHN|nr:hypothetical protein [Novosphingobium indicum]GGN43079.1 hypothetical protein GCM10011349_06790 [Novosphingobium indicum]|tara:strand:- start:415 stop:567 length:153 start_codon:yes stop_codon:yes gene_type:complete